MIDDYTKMRFIKTKEPVLDAQVSPPKVPDEGKVTEGKKE